MDIVFAAFLSASLSEPFQCDTPEQSTLTINKVTPLLIADKKGCGKGCTPLVDTIAPAKPKKCVIKLYTAETDIKRPFEKLCLLNASTGSTLFSNKSPEEATKRLKQAACKCGADAIIINDVNREGTSAFSWGKSTAKGIGIRYTGQPATVTPAQPSPEQSAETASASTSPSPVPPESVSPPSAPQADPYQIAKQTTVLVEGQNPGSGVIITKTNNTYYVLTAKHVVATPDEYEIVTHDGQRFDVSSQKIRRLPKHDLAMIAFTSNQSYPVARLGNSELAKQGMNIYVSGWPVPEQAITQPTHLVTKGEIVGLQAGDKEGYGLLYSNNTAPGMSGGPIFNPEGRLIGIHGRAAGNQVSGKVGINLGIPIKVFTESASQAGIDLQQLGLNAKN
ncbi:serine protease [Acaryochloris sp. IP29b_bin.148]|uniref:S1 family peptidase n=1 Tax=Acaryochloris sp. IP29b_bin.148 TaxID=2969218 RepID=UPI00260A176F|nr:serine protease [Acaryochloris sp. IP29b_bin.148]